MKTRIGIAILATFLLVPAGPASAISIYSHDIVNGEVKTADLDSNAVTTTKILNGEVKTADLGADAVTTDKILNGTIGTDDLANGAVTDAKISGQISSSKINSTGLNADTLDGIDSTGFAPTSHVHAQSDVTGLVGVLAGKADQAHTHDADYQRKVSNVIVVAKSGGDFTDPVAAVNSISDASPSNPYVVKLMPGVYDIGSQTVVLPPAVDLVGSGENATFIVGNGAVVIQAWTGNVEIRSLTVENSGNPTYTSWGIYVTGPFPVRIADVTATVRPASPYNSIGIGVYSAIVAMESVTVDCESGLGIAINPRSSSEPPVTLNNVKVTAVVGSGISVNSTSGGSTAISNVRVTADVDGLSTSGRLTLVNSDIQGGYVGVRVGENAVTSIMSSRLKGATSLMHGNSTNTSVTKVSFSEFDGAVLAYDTRLTCFQVHDGDLNSVACP